MYRTIRPYPYLVSTQPSWSNSVYDYFDLWIVSGWGSIILDLHQKTFIQIRTRLTKDFRPQGVQSCTVGSSLVQNTINTIGIEENCHWWGAGTVTYSLWGFLKKKALNTRIPPFCRKPKTLIFSQHAYCNQSCSIDQNKKNLEVLTGHPLKRMKFSRNYLRYSPFKYLDCFCPEELYPVCVMRLSRAHHAEGIRLGQQVSIDQVLTAADTPQFYMQCCGSVTFWYGYGCGSESSDPTLCLTDEDPEH